MRRKIAFLSAIVLSAAAVSCGHDNESSSPQGLQDTSAAYTETKTAEQKTSETTAADNTPSPQTFEMPLNNAEKPETVGVVINAGCSGDIKSHVRVTDVYGKNVLHSGVVGLVGCPVEVSYDDNVTEPELRIVYDPEQLRGIPEKNLIMLHFNENDQFYDTVSEAKLLNDGWCSVAANIREPGVYLLADAYQWYSAWGTDVSQYEYNVDRSQYESDWERENDTGSIMQLADKEWAKANAQNFKVSTKEELASAVYYVNAFSDGNTSYTITLLDDIDLTDTDWKPIGWSANGNSHGFSGCVNGNGHTIKGLHIRCDYEDCGFIGYGMNVVMHDINFTDAYVSGTACTGIAGGEIYGTSVWENVHTQGRVDGGNSDNGGIIGREASITFKNCSADAEVNGEKTEYPSYRQKVIAETEVEEVFHLTLNDDMTITRDHHEGFRNLCWLVEQDGTEVLQRGTDDPYTGEQELVLETKYQWIKNSSGRHTIYLVAFTGETYTRVSNIIEYTN